MRTLSHAYCPRDPLVRAFASEKLAAEAQETRDHECKLFYRSYHFRVTIVAHVKAPSELISIRNRLVWSDPKRKNGNLELWILK